MILQGGKRGRDVSLRKSGLSIWTIDGRMKAVPFWGPPGLAAKLDGWAFGDGRLSVTRKAVFLTLSFKKEVAQRTAPQDAVIGVDRGINVLACATDGKNQWMRKGGHIKHVRTRYLHVRSSLQRRKAQRPTRSVAKTLQRLSGRETRFMRVVNHEVSRSVIDFAEKAGCPVIAMEQLDGIREGRRRKKQRAEINRWAYRPALFLPDLQGDRAGHDGDRDRSFRHVQRLLALRAYRSGEPGPACFPVSRVRASSAR